MLACYVLGDNVDVMVTDGESVSVSGRSNTRFEHKRKIMGIRDFWCPSTLHSTTLSYLACVYVSLSSMVQLGRPNPWLIVTGYVLVVLVL